MAFRKLQTHVTSPRVSEQEYLLLSEVTAQPGNQFLRILHKPLRLHRWSDGCRIVHEVSLAGPALIPLDNCEVFFKLPRIPPCSRSEERRVGKECRSQRS